MKKFRSSFFLLSEAAGIVASSVYGLTLSFIVQRYVDSQFLNSLVSNISVTLSMLMAFFTGYIVDKKEDREGKKEYKKLFFIDYEQKKLKNLCVFS